MVYDSHIQAQQESFTYLTQVEVASMGLEVLRVGTSLAESAINHFAAVQFNSTGGNIEARRNSGLSCGGIYFSAEK